MNSQNKFTVIYSFKILDNTASEFIDAWTKLTKLIYEFEGSYGSRLHKVNQNLFIGYAQWPDRSTFESAGKNLPVEADAIRQTMRSCCAEIKTEFELDEITVDLIQNQKHKTIAKSINRGNLKI